MLGKIRRYFEDEFSGLNAHVTNEARIIRGEIKKLKKSVQSQNDVIQSKLSEIEKNLATLTQFVSTAFNITQVQDDPSLLTNPSPAERQQLKHLAELQTQMDAQIGTITGLAPNPEDVEP